MHETKTEETNAIYMIDGGWVGGLATGALSLLGKRKTLDGRETEGRKKREEGGEGCMKNGFRRGHGGGIKMVPSLLCRVSFFALLAPFSASLSENFFVLFSVVYILFEP